VSAERRPRRDNTYIWRQLTGRGDQSTPLVFIALQQNDLLQRKMSMEVIDESRSTT
jgi:hypothetical protein